MMLLNKAALAIPDLFICYWINTKTSSDFAIYELYILCIQFQSKHTEAMLSDSMISLTTDTLNSLDLGILNA